MNTQNLLDQYFETAFSAPDGIKRLRELILSLAMQGKLVPQDPNDQPARELLQEIEAEKERLIKEKKIKKQKPLPEIRPEEIPYDLPESWEWVRLGDIGEINPKNSFEDEQKTGFVPMPLISQEYAGIHNFEVRKWKEIKKGYTHFADGDVGLAKITPCFENGKSCIFRNLPNGIGAGTTELHIFRNTFNAIYQEYLLVQFKNPRYLQIGASQMTGTAGQKRVTKSFFAEYPFPLPPLAEQKRIVEKCDRLMEQCDKLEKLRAEKEQKRILIHTAAREKLLTAKDQEIFGQAWDFIKENFGELYAVKDNVTSLRQAILQLAVMGKLVPQDPNDPPASELLKEIEAERQDLLSKNLIKKEKELTSISPQELQKIQIPTGWKAVHLGEVVYCLDFKRRPIRKDERVIGNVPYYGANGRVGWINEYLFDEELVLVCEDETFIGRTLPFSYKIEGKSWVNNHAHVLKPSVGINVNFLNYSLSYYPFIALTSGTTGRRKLTKNTLLNIPYLFPPRPEQHRIVAKVHALMTLCDQLEQQIEQQTAKQTQLLESVMAGV